MKTYKGMEYVTLEEMKEYGYSPEPYAECPEVRMIPLTREQALFAYDNNKELFMLYKDDAESYVYSDEDFQNVIDWGLMFGMEVNTDEDWLEKLYVEFNITK